MKKCLLLVAAWLLVGFRPALSADHNGAIDEDPPVIDIELTPNRSSTTADFLVYDGEALSFDGSGSYDPDGGALTKHDWTINYTSGKPKDYAGVVFDTSYALANGSMQTMRLLIRDDENNYVSKTVTIEVVAAPVVEWERTYFIRDHLGSVRVAFNEEGDVVEATDYYPFGMQMPTRSVVAGPGVKENFTGHELDAGIGLLYAGARMYDPVAARWMTVDPLAEEFPGWSPYNYALNNPVGFNDPSGMAACDITLCGSNGSSLTIETDLVDGEVDVSGLGIDFGGNHSVSGEDVVLAALDVVGVVDPTGIADGIATTIYATRGEIGNTLISAAGVVPFIGDLAKAGRIGKSVAKLTDAAKGGAQSAANGLRLQKQLGSAEQLADLASGGGRAIAGAGTKTPLRDVGRLVDQYGGSASDWTKITSGSRVAADGTRFEIHAYRNVTTGQLVEAKTKF